MTSLTATSACAPSGYTIHQCQKIIVSLWRVTLWTNDEYVWNVCTRNGCFSTRAKKPSGGTARDRSWLRFTAGHTRRFSWVIILLMSERVVDATTTQNGAEVANLNMYRTACGSGGQCIQARKALHHHQVITGEEERWRGSSLRPWQYVEDLNIFKRFRKGDWRQTCFLWAGGPEPSLPV